MTKHLFTQPSEIKSELLALTGSQAAYEQLLADLGEQMRSIAQKRGPIDLKHDILNTSKPVIRWVRRKK